MKAFWINAEIGNHFFQGNQSTPLLLSPPSTNGQRRRSSVMFSDEVTTLNSGSETKNVCSSEKMTQTGDGEIWQSNRINTNDNQIQVCKI